MSLAALKKRSSKKQAKVSKDKDDEPTGNCQLRALEAHMLKLSRQGKFTKLFYNFSASFGVIWKMSLKCVEMWIPITVFPI